MRKGRWVGGKRYSFLGKYTHEAKASGNTYYKRLVIEVKGAQRIHVVQNQSVLLQAPDASNPYVAQIKEMWTDGKGRKWFSATWYFRLADLHDGHDKLIPQKTFPNELFISSFVDKNVVHSIVDVCTVHEIQEDFPTVVDILENDRVYYCRYMYAPGTRHIFSALKKGKYEHMKRDIPRKGETVEDIDLGRIKARNFSSKGRTVLSPQSAGEPSRVGSSRVGSRYQAQVPDIKEQTRESALGFPTAEVLWSPSRLTDDAIVDFLKRIYFKLLKIGDAVHIRSGRNVTVEAEIIEKCDSSFTYKVLERNSRKVKEVSSFEIIERYAEDEVLAHLHKCEYNVSAALNSFLVEKSGKSDWTVEEIDALGEVLNSRGQLCFREIATMFPRKTVSDIVDFYHVTDEFHWLWENSSAEILSRLRKSLPMQNYSIVSRLPMQEVENRGKKRRKNDVDGAIQDVGCVEKKSEKRAGSHIASVSCKKMKRNTFDRRDGTLVLKETRGKPVLESDTMDTTSLKTREEARVQTCLKTDNRLLCFSDGQHQIGIPCASTDEASSACPPNTGRSNMKMPATNTAVSFLERVRTTLQKREYDLFLEILCAFHVKEVKKADMVLRVAEIFQPHTKLLEDFVKHFVREVT